MRFSFVIFVCFFITGLAADLATFAQQAAITKRPNVLFILSDDHAVNAIGCYKKRLSAWVRTPHIDQLASEGMMFTNTFCTNSICSPSRATILSGTYSHKNGVYGLNQPFDSTQQTMASVLHDNGYQTAVYGKWHLVTRPAGFDDYKVLDEQGRYMNPEFFEKDAPQMVRHEGWVDDVTEKMAETFIQQRDPGKPFAVFLHYKSVHDPWDTRPPFDTCYENMTIPEPANICDGYATMGEAALHTTLKLESIDQRTFRHQTLKTTDTCAQRHFVYQQFVKAFLRGANVLDENVGKILAYLKEQGLDKNTIVVYTSDQGHFLGEHGFFSKRFMYDESMQMPLIVRYPSMIRAGSVNNDLVSNIDFAPTVLDMVGLPVPGAMQGVSMVPLLKQEPGRKGRDGIYYHYYEHMIWRKVPGHYGIRTRKYKLIFFYGLNLGQTDLPPTTPQWELYDLEKDPGEDHNVYGGRRYRHVVRKLKKELLALKKKYGDMDDPYPELMEVDRKYFWKE